MLLQTLGNVLGTDRIDGSSPRGNGDDEAVAVGVLMQIGGELGKAAVPLLAGRQVYAGLALLRQIVEVEYLAWAFATKAGDAKAWLNASRRERESFFRPARLRERSGGRFRSVDYAHHCEMGGHPVPNAVQLLDGSTKGVQQLALVDLLQHGWRTWDSLVAWAKSRPFGGEVILPHADRARAELKAWSNADPLYDLPPSPPLE